MQMAAIGDLKRNPQSVFMLGDGCFGGLGVHFYFPPLTMSLLLI